jgi:hypothetical protein
MDLTGMEARAGPGGGESTSSSGSDPEGHWGRAPSPVRSPRGLANIPRRPGIGDVTPRRRGPRRAGPPRRPVRRGGYLLRGPRPRDGPSVQRAESRDTLSIIMRNRSGVHSPVHKVFFGIPRLAARHVADGRHRLDPPFDGPATRPARDVIRAAPRGRWDGRGVSRRCRKVIISFFCKRSRRLSLIASFSRASSCLNF